MADGQTTRLSDSMDPRTLTDQQITDGELFIEQLTKAGITVDVAFWVRTTDDDSCYLYIARPRIGRFLPNSHVVHHEVYRDRI